MSTFSNPSFDVPLQADTEFWYADGNVVIKVDKSLFKLHRDRLAGVSVYFAKLFGSHSGSNNYASVDGCPVYPVRPGITPTSFRNILRVLDTPIAYSGGLPSEDNAIELLHTADLLCCTCVLVFAKHALAKHWDAPTVPCPESSRTYEDATTAILLARQYGISGVLKRAFYEALSKPAFWAVLSANPGPIQLPRAYVDRMHNARVELGRLWREFALRAPGTNKKGKSKCQKEHKQNCNRFEFDYKRQRPIGRCNGDSEHRKLSWREFVVTKGVMEDGAADPIRYNLVAARKKELDKAWCDACLEGWEAEWKKARVDWWNALDSMLWL
ncbi:hypothetical protein L226DRAFT_386941 [Lentinus tigrinus ALCF2SS1-7]|uniref:uncharacterized protein n=1 Tax=Lentinus tigrinus ALCF2SS1-7 TaxID=1328758 RepID=UPI001165CE81|nr:hypothetical protein L226DRAFT_386941 [Lentinus tigrinus ALCF2SS1-7]